jgi:hypothetical protein
MIIRSICICLSLVLISCCKYEPSCPPASKEFHPIHPDDKAKLPHSGNDTIKLRNSSDSILLIGSGITISQRCEDKTSNPDCPLNLTQWCYEQNDISYQDEKGIFRLIMSLGGGTDLKAMSTAGFLYPYNFKLTLNGTSEFYCFASDISRRIGDNTIPSMTINGQTFLNVTYLNRSIDDSTSRVYLNETDGVLKIELDNKQIVWERY